KRCTFSTTDASYWFFGLFGSIIRTPIIFLAIQREMASDTNAPAKPIIALKTSNVPKLMPSAVIYPPVNENTMAIVVSTNTFVNIKENIRFPIFFHPYFSLIILLNSKKLLKILVFNIHLFIILFLQAIGKHHYLKDI